MGAGANREAKKQRQLGGRAQRGLEVSVAAKGGARNGRGGAAVSKDAAAPDDGRDGARSETKEARRARLNEEVERAWRDGGALEGATEDIVVRTVRGTVQVARHYAALIDQQKFNYGKYGEGEVLPDTHMDARWIAGRLCVVSRVTGVGSENVSTMVEVSGVGILELEAAAAMRVMLALKALIPNADASHMVRVEPDLLLVDDVARLAYGGADTMRTLRAMSMPEPCVRLGEGAYTPHTSVYLGGFEVEAENYDPYTKKLLTKIINLKPETLHCETTLNLKL